MERKDLPFPFRDRAPDNKRTMVGAAFLRPDPPRVGVSTKRKRCAIYTRKSTEEGLDQEFNSLDAQREAALVHNP